MLLRFRIPLVAALLILNLVLLGSPATALALPAVVGLVFNEDGNSIAVIDPKAYRLIKVLELDDVLKKPHLAAYDPDSQRLYVGNKGANLAVFDLSSPLDPRLIANLTPGGTGEIHRVVVAGGMVWLAHEGDSTVYAYDRNDLSAPRVALGSALGFDTTHGLTVRPGTGDRELWTTNRPTDAPGTVIRIDARTSTVIGQPLPTTGTAGDRPNNVTFTPDGRLAYVANTGAKATEVTVVDAASLEVVAQIKQDAQLGRAPHAMVYEPRTQRLFVVNKDSGTVSAIDTRTNSVVGYIAVGAEAHGVTVGPDGQIWATAKQANRVTVIDPRSLTVTASITDRALVGPHFLLFIPSGDGGSEDELLAFPETGYNASGELLRAWRAGGGLPTFGFPLSPIQSNDGAVSQWFERARIELHADKPQPYSLALGLLGVEALQRNGIDWRALPAADGAPSGCRYFAMTRHTLCREFLAYWRGHGLDLGDRGVSERESLALFGYPISEPQSERNASGDTVLTQWFERSRFELHPSAPAHSRVLLGRLGAELQAQQAASAARASDLVRRWATAVEADTTSAFAYYCD